MPIPIPYLTGTRSGPSRLQRAPVRSIPSRTSIFSTAAPLHPPSLMPSTHLFFDIPVTTHTRTHAHRLDCCSAARYYCDIVCSTILVDARDAPANKTYDPCTGRTDRARLPGSWFRGCQAAGPQRGGERGKGPSLACILMCVCLPASLALAWLHEQTCRVPNATLCWAKATGVDAYAAAVDAIHCPEFQVLPGHSTWARPSRSLSPTPSSSPPCQLQVALASSTTT